MNDKLLIFALMAAIGCQSCQLAPEAPAHQIYGLVAPAQDSLGVEIDLAQFRDLSAVAQRAEAISCNDSLPKIVLRGKEAIKSIYLYSLCWEQHFGCGDGLWRRNLFSIQNGLIYKSDAAPRPLDSLQALLAQDFGNYGEDPMLSERPRKLLIHITYDSAGVDVLPSLLARITEAYEQAVRSDDTTANLNVQLMPPLPPPPPPPPPPPVRYWN